MYTCAPFEFQNGMRGWSNKEDCTHAVYLEDSNGKRPVFVGSKQECEENANKWGLDYALYLMTKGTKAETR